MMEFQDQDDEQDEEVIEFDPERDSSIVVKQSSSS